MLGIRLGPVALFTLMFRRSFSTLSVVMTRGAIDFLALFLVSGSVESPLSMVNVEFYCSN